MTAPPEKSSALAYQTISADDHISSTLYLTECTQYCITDYCSISDQYDNVDVYTMCTYGYAFLYSQPQSPELLR